MTRLLIKAPILLIVVFLGASFLLQGLNTRSVWPGADIFVKNLHQIVASGNDDIPVLKTVAIEQTGINQLFGEIKTAKGHGNKKSWLLAARAYHLIQQKRMQDITLEKLEEMIEREISNNQFNLFSFVQRFDR